MFKHQIAFAFFIVLTTFHRGIAGRDIIEWLEHELKKDLSLLNDDLRLYSEDPEVRLSTPEIIKHWGYPSEEHWATTNDGYILGLHRIPRGKNEVSPNGSGHIHRPAVLLQHGLLCSSSNWITNLPHQSLGFILADAGFDVWMGNNRGNTYSKNHTWLSPTSAAFWKFSWTEMAEADLPAMIDLILNVTGQRNLHYIGHSQGTMIMFAKGSLDTDGSFSQKIKSFTALGPVSRIGHMESQVFRYLAKISNPLSWIFKMIGKNEFLPSSQLLDILARLTCGSRLKFLCSNFLFLITDFEIDNLNQTRIPVYFSHTPAGTSVQNMHHFAQLYTGKEWTRFDWGARKNKEIYGQSNPPSFDPTKISIPVYAYYGAKDIFTTLPDVYWLLTKLPNLREAVYDPSMDHLGYIWGLDARERVYKRVMMTLRKIA